MSINSDGNVEAIDCPECSGSGEVEIERHRPHSFNRDVGVIDVTKGECETCAGIGAIPKEDEIDE
jgi:DnaJ-class molecular chaperone